MAISHLSHARSTTTSLTTQDEISPNLIAFIVANCHFPQMFIFLYRPLISRAEVQRSFFRLVALMSHGVWLANDDVQSELKRRERKIGGVCVCNPIVYCLHKSTTSFFIDSMMMLNKSRARGIKNIYNEIDLQTQRAGECLNLIKMIASYQSRLIFFSHSSIIILKQPTPPI